MEQTAARKPINKAMNDNERPQQPVVGPLRDPLTLSDEHVNQSRRFAGLPPLDAKELKSWRGYLRWMRERFSPRPQ